MVVSGTSLMYILKEIEVYDDHLNFSTGIEVKFSKCYMEFSKMTI